MELLKLDFLALGYDTAGIDNQILVDTTGPVPDSCSGKQCTLGCANGCATCSPRCSNGTD